MTAGPSLTARQHTLLRFVVREHAMGRTPTYRQMARALGTTHPGSAHATLQRIRERLGTGGIEALVPRAPDGAPLRFIPVDGA